MLSALCKINGLKRGEKRARSAHDSQMTKHVLYPYLELLLAS